MHTYIHIYVHVCISAIPSLSAATCVSKAVKVSFITEKSFSMPTRLLVNWFPQWSFICETKKRKYSYTHTYIQTHMTRLYSSYTIHTHIHAIVLNDINCTCFHTHIPRMQSMQFMYVCMYVCMYIWVLLAWPTTSFSASKFAERSLSNLLARSCLYASANKSYKVYVCMYRIVSKLHECIHVIESVYMLIPCLWGKWTLPYSWWECYPARHRKASSFPGVLSKYHTCGCLSAGRSTPDLKQMV